MTRHKFCPEKAGLANARGLAMARAQAGITQTEIARLGHVSLSTICKIENGGTAKIMTIKAIERAYALALKKTLPEEDGTAVGMWIEAQASAFVRERCGADGPGPLLVTKDELKHLLRLAVYAWGPRHQADGGRRHSEYEAQEREIEI